MIVLGLLQDVEHGFLVLRLGFEREVGRVLVGLDLDGRLGVNYAVGVFDQSRVLRNLVGFVFELVRKFLGDSFLLLGSLLEQLSFGLLLLYFSLKVKPTSFKARLRFGAVRVAELSLYVVSNLIIQS